jgi:hypothetical protein
MRQAESCVVVKPYLTRLGKSSPLIGHHDPLRTFKVYQAACRTGHVVPRGASQPQDYFPHKPFAVQSDAMVIHGCDASWRTSTNDRRCSVPVTESLIG